MNRVVAFFIILLFGFPVLAQADYRLYMADIDEVRWQFLEVPEGRPHALECRLSQSIPQYGVAHFVTMAGLEPEFFFNVTQEIIASEAELFSKPSAWQTSPERRYYGEIPIRKEGKYFLQRGNVVWKLLSELEKGFTPTVYYTEQAQYEDDVEVRVSAIKFREYYNDYLACQRKVLSFGFDQVEVTNVYFKFASDELSNQAIRELDKVRQYLMTDDNIIAVQLEAHSDSKGQRAYNERLAKKRAETIKQFFQEKNIPAEKFSIKVFGETRPIANNDRRKGRAKNRRVVVRLIKPIV